MKRVADATQVTNDRLVVEYHFPDGRRIRQGKRVAADCPLTADERRAYAVHGPVRACRVVMDNRGISLAEAWELIKATRGYAR